MRNSILIFSFLAVFGLACSPKIGHKIHSFPDPVDTNDKPIELQEKRTYSIAGIHCDNQFEGARLNGFEQVNETTFRAIISPENKPINHSAYFAFQIWSDTIRNIELELKYTHHPHRYIPKLSYDGDHWINMNTSDFDTLKGPQLATLRLQVGPQKLYVAGQELFTSSDAASWCKEQTKHAQVNHTIIGKSKLGRDLHFLDIYQGTPNNKKAIAIISRQHPPEVSGQYAMNAFVDELLMDNVLSNQFREQFRILVYPMLNPDGVDLGHWRHTAGGIDMNRDWSEYNQVEVAQVTKHMVDITEAAKNKVLVGLDFHSTQEDIFYTLTPDLKSTVFPFKDYWYEGIDQSFERPIGEDAPYSLNKPISKGWFYLQFDAEGITYEVGDETPRAFVDAKARVSARELMKLLILDKNED